jgi:hypothetical protein
MEKEIQNPNQQQTLEKKADKNQENNSNFNVWTMISLVEFVLILFLLFRLFKRKEKPTSSNKAFSRDEIVNEKIDYENILKSSFQARDLYDKLKKKCHPDRFPTDLEINKIADELFQEIQKNKTNLKRLEELKEEAISKLKISF